MKPLDSAKQHVFNSNDVIRSTANKHTPVNKQHVNGESVSSAFFFLHKNDNVTECGKNPI